MPTRPSPTLALRPESNQFIMAGFFLTKVPQGMRCQWLLNRTPQVLGKRGPGQPGGKPGTSFTSRVRACLAMPSPGPAGCQDRPRPGKEREGGHPKAQGTPCQQASVLWQHSRPDSNSETKDFLPPLACHQFPRALPGATGLSSVVIKILVRLFHPPCEQERGKEIRWKRRVSVCPVAVVFPAG